MTIKKAIIPVAGYGTRLLPFTKAIPKEMINIVDKPAIQYVVEEAVASGIEEIIIITTEHKESIRLHFSNNDHINRILKEQDQKELIEGIDNLATISYLVESEPKGLGHSILQAKDFIGDEAFAVLLADDLIDSCKPCLQQLIEKYNRTKKTTLATMNVAESEVEQYGIVSGKKVNDLFLVENIVEKPISSQSKKAVIGRYIFTPEIFMHLEKTFPGKNNEIQLTDGIRNLLADADVYSYDFEGSRYDLGSKLGCLKANIAYGLKHIDTGNDLKSYLKTLDL